MRPWTYPIIAFIFNLILFNSFHWGEYGGALEVVITAPLIAVISLVLTFIHYQLDKKKQKTKYLQFSGIIAVILVSYFLFPTQNMPISVIKKLVATARHYNEITINDYFLDYRYENYEKIVAAKKKFNRQLADTAYSVNISNNYNYKQLYKTYGINFIDNRPIATDSSLKIERVADNLFKFTDYLLGDTISYSGGKLQMNVGRLRTDSFSEFGAGHFKDTTLKEVDVKHTLKQETPDEYFWAYKVFYWLL